MKCSCNGACRTPPYKCARGDWSRQYDPDYGRNMKKFTVKDIEDQAIYRHYDSPVTIKNVVKD